MDLIREDYVLGNKKIVVGDNLHDLVLENLGKIWVRYGNGYKEFSQFVSTLAKAVTSISKVVIEPDGMQSPESYKSGQLVFDARKKNLHMKYDGELLLLLEYNDLISEKYVNKGGDTMTGPLVINVKDDLPLYVVSKKLVKNLNSELFDSHKSNEFPLKAEDEKIAGNWTFNGNDTHNGINEFNNQVTINGELDVNGKSDFYAKSHFHKDVEVNGLATFTNNGTAIKVGTGDIVTSGSIGSSQFMSGMTGYGWRLDADTNTLTIDNLIVRGVLSVFELVVNKISATNGSLWITDSFKIDKVHEIKYLKSSDFLNYVNGEGETVTININDLYLRGIFNLDNCYILETGFKTTVTPSLTNHPYATRSSFNDSNKTFDKYKWIFLILNLDDFVNKFLPTITKVEKYGETSMSIESYLEYYLFNYKLNFDADGYLNIMFSDENIDFSQSNNLPEPRNYTDKKYLSLIDGVLKTSNSLTNAIHKDDIGNTITVYVTREVSQTTNAEYSLLDLFDETKLKELAASQIILLAHVFQHNDTSVDLMESIPNSNLLIVSDGWNDLTSQLFTIVNASLVNLSNGKYTFNSDALARINLYYKYFGSNSTNGMNIYVLESNHDEYPVFKIGDIIKCQKFIGTSVKQYHALVIGALGDYSFIVQLLNYSVVLEGISYEYNEDGQLHRSNLDLDSTLYQQSPGLNLALGAYFSKAEELLYKYINDRTIDTNWCIDVLIDPSESETYKNSLNNASTNSEIEAVIASIIENSVLNLTYEQAHQHPIFSKALEDKTFGVPEKDDALVRIGSIMFGDRRNSMYLTSSEGNSPYTDVLVGVNRPDYTVIYLTPKYVKFEASLLFDNKYRKGIYYLLNDEFAKIMQSQGGNNPESQAIYNKYKDFSILVNRPEQEVISTNIINTYLTFLPTEHTLYGHNGLPLTYTMPSTNITYYMSSDSNDKIINQEQIGSDDVLSGVYTINGQNITLSISDNKLVTYKKDNNVANERITKNRNVVFIDEDYVNTIEILPLLLNGQEDFTESNVVSVIATLKIYDDEEIVKTLLIPYNKTFLLPNAKAVTLKLEFKINSTTLSKEIKFYKLPSSLYTYITSGHDTFEANEYEVSSFDLISETPVISKWGCLLLTNTYDVIETKKVNNTSKGIAELVPTTKVRMGNLSGIYNETFGNNQPKGFGLYGESVYLTGNFYLNNGKSLIDINNDVTIAVGNINRIQNTLNNLNSSLLDSIYNLTISEAALTASFNETIANNNDALFKLGKDYSLWAVGNAGISIINPNVSYDENGNVDDSTVGDGDEYIFLQGESVQIATSISEEYNNLNYIKVIVSNTNPLSFVYNNNNLYNPFLSDLQTHPLFSVGWVKSTDLNSATKVSVNATENTKLFRYVALNKHLNVNRGQLTIASTDLNIEDHDFYSFSTSRQLTGTSIYSDDTFTNTFDNNTYYVIKDVVISGMFVDGKFNANLIEVKNILAMDSSEENGVRIYKKNPNFDITQPINDNNYPVLKNSNNDIAKDAPFAVISGTTGKITALGVDLKEAVIGGTRVSGNNIVVGKNDITGEHIRIVDNYGILVTPDYFNNSSMTTSVKDTKPAIYFRNGEEVISKISSDKDTTLEKFFKNSKTTNLVTNVSKTLFNNTSITYNRLLTVANGIVDGPSNETIIGADGYYYFKVDKSELSYFSDGDFYGVVRAIVLYNQPVYRKTGSNTFTQISDNGHISTSLYSTYNEFYYRSNIECDSFLPTRTKLRVRVRSTTLPNVTILLPYAQLCNSDILKVEYSTSSVTSSNIALSNSNITLSSNNNASYEISGSLKAKLHNSIKLKHLSVTKAENSAVITHSNSLSNGFAKYINGQLCITLNIILRNVNDSDDYIILKTIKYFTKCTSKTTAVNDVDITTYYPDGVTTYDGASTAENDISNPNVDSVDCNVYEFISNSENNFNDNVIRFSKFIKGDDKTYSLHLLANIDFNQTGRIGDYKFNKQYSINNDNLGPTAYELPDDPNIIQYSAVSFDDESGSSSATSFGTPRDNGYEWHPLLCPKLYTVYPLIDVTNCTINKTLISEKTIILGNGFLTGYSNLNQFTVSFMEDGDNIIFKKLEFIKGVGSILSNNGFFNAFYVNNALKQIPQPIPILYGSLYPNSRYETVRTSRKYEYYSFSGYSLISGNLDNFGGNNDDVFLLNNIFQYIRSYTKSEHISRNNNPIIYGNVHYMKNYDLYLISEEGLCGRVVLLFGSLWDLLFVQYGTSLFINVIPKFRNYGSSSYEALIIDNANNTIVPNIVTSYQKEPIIVDISLTLKNISFLYQKITGINNDVYTFATQNPIECTSMYGYEFDCYSAWPIVYLNVLDDKYHGALDIVPGYFDIVINYIPNLSN